MLGFLNNFSLLCSISQNFTSKKYPRAKPILFFLFRLKLNNSLSKSLCNSNWAGPHLQSQELTFSLGTGGCFREHISKVLVAIPTAVCYCMGPLTRQVARLSVSGTHGKTDVQTSLSSLLPHHSSCCTFLPLGAHESLVSSE